jgi:hypothetical protein
VGKIYRRLDVIPLWLRSTKGFKDAEDFMYFIGEKNPREMEHELYSALTCSSYDDYTDKKIKELRAKEKSLKKALKENKKLLEYFECQEMINTSEDKK